MTSQTTATQRGQQRDLFETPEDTLHMGRAMARALVSSVKPDDHVRLARGFAFALVSAFWESLWPAEHETWSIHDLPNSVELTDLSESARAVAQSMGAAAAQLDVMEAGYIVGGVYTAMLPTDLRTRLGAYYTPPALCERLLDMAAEGGVNWAMCKALDPACGGGAFLSPVARRMLDSLGDRSPRIALHDIVSRLSGFELDPFAAWMSQVFLEATLKEICQEAGMRLPSMVRICDSLEQTPQGEGFDLVVGNPPYGRITLSPDLRDRYRRSLFGHANLYGVFTDLALRFARAGGVIAYVTPTSFLAGEYFKALRGLLGREAPPASIDFIVQRQGVFEDVQQETLLAAYRRGGNPAAGKVHFISPSKDGWIKTTVAGSFRLPKNPQNPWLVPRLKGHGKLVRQMRTMPHRLADYGYTVSTGPLVWNRHKPLLRDAPGKGRYPLIWAEAVRAEGEFEFRSEKKNHKPYFQPGQKEQWVVTREPCVLLQRTTAKEQSRRLIAAELPQNFIKQHGAVVIENHLNMIRPTSGMPSVSPTTIAALLNSRVVDQAFRCINGSVAVSAYELEALPLPSPEGMTEIERLVKRGAKRETINRALERMYRGGGG